MAHAFAHICSMLCPPARQQLLLHFHRLQRKIQIPILPIRFPNCLQDLCLLLVQEHPARALLLPKEQHADNFALRMAGLEVYVIGEDRERILDHAREGELLAAFVHVG